MERRTVKVLFTEFHNIDKGRKAIHSILRISTSCEFTLAFFPKGFESSSSYAYLVLQYEGQMNSKMRVNIWFRASRVLQTLPCDGYKKFEPNSKIIGVALYSIQGKNYKPSDILEVEITFESRTRMESSVKYPTALSVNDNLWSQVQSCDFSVLCNDHIIPVHKRILESRSYVLRTMLQSGMMEASSNALLVPSGYSTQTVKVFLYYLYSSRFTAAVDRPEQVWQLLLLSHMYGVEGLQRLCEAHMTKQVTVLNCETMLANAEVMNCEVLKKFIVRFIQRNR